VKFPAEFADLRNGASYIWTGYDITKQEGKPKMITIDIPFAGVGVELSEQGTHGRIEILD
jgi:hypothetical protein